MKCDNDSLISNESLFFMKHTLENVVPMFESNKLLIAKARQTIAAFSYEIVTIAES